MSSHFKEKRNPLPVIISLIVIFISAMLIYLQPPFIKKILIKAENDAYDDEIRSYHRPLPKDNPVVIIDIDDKSIAKYGRWPWNRKILGEMSSELVKLGAKAVAFDIVFSEDEINPVQTILDSVDSPSLKEELEPLKSRFDTDQSFADALKTGAFSLGFAFLKNGEMVGSLPDPIIEVSDEEMQKLTILRANGYLGNLPLFQKAARHGGFINATVDSDGILRSTPLVYLEGDKVYPSLSLEAAELFLDRRVTKIVTHNAGDKIIIKSVDLGDISIRTDPWGRILIPYRGGAFTFPYISVGDLLEGKVERAKIQDKLVFIGSSATAIGDLRATAISSVYPGVEVHASVASGIIDGYLPYKVIWGRHASAFFLVGLGFLVALLLPFMSHLVALLFSFGMIVIFKVANYYVWKNYGMALSFFFPAPTIVVLLMIDFIAVFVIKSRERQEIKRVLGQYVSPQYIDQMIKMGQHYSSEGELKELSVLYADINEFNSISKQAEPKKIKEFLNSYFNVMSGVVFDRNGVIDKYNVDQLKAFWGDPLRDERHYFHAVETALRMRDQAKGLKLPVVGKAPHISIGIHTSTMLVGDMGSKYQADYTVIGDGVELSLFSKRLTKLYGVEIIADVTTKEKTQEQYVYRHLDMIGVDDKVLDIYEVIGEKGKVDSSILEELQIHEKAIDSYFKGDFETANKLFSQIKILSKDLYLERMKTPPPNNWKGVVDKKNLIYGKGSL